MNDIPLTIRLPSELNLQLATASKFLGLTKTNLLRATIHHDLARDGENLRFTAPVSGKKHRLVFNVNRLTFEILENISARHGQTMNAVIVAVAMLAVELSATWLRSVSE